MQIKHIMTQILTILFHNASYVRIQSCFDCKLAL